MSQALLIEAPPAVIERIRNAQIDGVVFSEPALPESGGDILDSPLGGAEILLFIEFITALLSSGVALLALIEKLHDVMGPKESVVLRDPSTGKVLARLEKQSDLDEIVKKLS